MTCMEKTQMTVKDMRDRARNFTGYIVAFAILTFGIALSNLSVWAVVGCLLVAMVLGASMMVWFVLSLGIRTGMSERFDDVQER